MPRDRDDSPVDARVLSGPVLQGTGLLLLVALGPFKKRCTAAFAGAFLGVYAGSIGLSSPLRRIETIERLACGA